MKLDKMTGIFSFDNYVITPDITHYELVEKYPDVRLERDEQTVTLERERIYYFPPTYFHEHHVNVRIVYFTQYISGIQISRVYSEQKTISESFWTTELVDWTKQAQNWLTEQLGMPHRDEAGELFDEQEHLSEDDLATLRSWEYIFDWGRALYYFDSLQQPGEICINPDYHYRVNNWDQLLSQVDYYASLSEQNLTNYEPIFNVINILKDNFEYLTLRPIIHRNLDGLLFYLKQWSHWDNKTWVQLNINSNNPTGIYRLSRPDSRKKVITSDLQEIVEAVKFFTSDDFVS